MAVDLSGPFGEQGHARPVEGDVRDPVEQQSAVVAHAQHRAEEQRPRVSASETSHCTGPPNRPP
nr:hypothetical protein [Streptomyces antimycoticus]